MHNIHRTTYIGIITALVIAAGVGYVLWQYTAEGHATDAGASQAAAVVQVGTVPAPLPGTEIEIKPSGVPVDPTVISQAAPPPAGYVEYRNTTYGFSFYHAPEARVVEYDEGGGAETVVVENFDKMRGFQVFIVPYAESKISEARFHEDVPSGVRENVQNTTLDGVQAVTFTSTDAMLGDTREIWSIRGGYLYEITTFAGVGNWFTPIIESWKFF